MISLGIPGGATTAILLGAFMIKFPLSTIVLGLVLGPLAESEFRRSLEMSNGDLSIFFTRPISFGLLILAAIAFIYGLYKTYKQQSAVKVIAD